ncbi:MAG: tetratricopeptide repeat protein, partial [Myxococcales bacterium]|nr:tetratricopeptide repeat protein [Myxococcales bacterium]
AKDDLKRPIALNDSVAGYYEKLGTILIELEDWQGAKAAFEGSIERDPSLFKAYYKLAQVYEQLDDPQHALEQYTKAIQMGPRFLEAYSQLGRLYANLGYLNEGVQVLRGALEVAQSGSAEAANVHHLLGTVYQQQGNLDEAVNQFKAALTIEPGMTDALFSLGWTYALQNNKEEASRFLKKFLDVGTGKAPEHYIKAARDRLAELESTI